MKAEGDAGCACEVLFGEGFLQTVLWSFVFYLWLSPLQYILAVGSSVFYAMFYGELAENKSDIHIPDVEPAAFLILLK